MDTRRWSAWLLAGLMLVAAAVPAVAAPEEGGPADQVQVFIGFDEAPGPAAHALVARHGGSVTHSYDLVSAVAASMPQRSLDGLARNPQVAYVEPVIEATAVDDTAGHAAELDEAWGVERIGAGLAHHDGFTGATADGPVRVAVLDSGIDVDHPDVTYDGDCSQTWYGTLDDGSSHGTHVAGTVAALRNGNGVVGVAPDVALCVFKVLGDNGSGSFGDVVAALDWIADFNGDPDKHQGNPIRVTNNSYGASTDPGTTVRDAFAKLEAENVLHVAAAGNAGNPPGNGSNCIYPAIYDSVVAVAATDGNDDRARFSSTCAEVELSAPGVSITSTIPGGGWGAKSGTSMASPHAAGAAALVFAAGATQASQVRTILTDTATGLAGGPSRTGAGLVNAHAAVLAVGTPPPETATGTIAGRVTDADTTLSISGATVVVDLGDTTLSDTTASDGSYSIAGVPAGATYDVTASNTSYTSVTSTSPAVIADATVTVDFALDASSGSDPGTDPEPEAPITLTVEPYKDRGLQKAHLAWEETNQEGVIPAVDIYFNGVVLVPNTTASPYTHHIDDRGGATYTYQVCEAAAMAVCSDVVTVQF